MEIETVEPNPYVLLRLEHDEAENLVMALEYARDNCAWQSVTEFSTLLLEKLAEQGW